MRKSCQCLPTFFTDDSFQGQGTWALKLDRFDTQYLIQIDYTYKLTVPLSYCSDIAICSPCKLNFGLCSLPKGLHIHIAEVLSPEVTAQTIRRTNCPQNCSLTSLAIGSLKNHSCCWLQLPPRRRSTRWRVDSFWML